MLNMKQLLAMLSKIPKHSGQIARKISHDAIIRNAKTMIKGESKEDQVFILTYIIDAIVDDLCHSTASNVLQKSIDLPIKYFIPTFYHDEQGNEMSISKEEKISVDLSNDNVYSYPYNKKKIIRGLFDLRSEPFFYDENNHYANYFTDINICHVRDGYHHIHIGRYYKKGSIMADVMQTELLYPHCTTDGLNWYNFHTGEIIEKVYDFRIATAYSIAQLRDKIRTDTDK